MRRKVQGNDNPSSEIKNLYNRQPIDALARRVTGKGEHHDVPLGNQESETPLPIWRWFGPKKHNLTGSVRGLLIVVGPASVETRYNGPGVRPTKKSSAGSLWVVRCQCGTYGLRRSKRFKRVEWDSCERCKVKGLGPAANTFGRG